MKEKIFYKLDNETYYDFNMLKDYFDLSKSKLYRLINPIKFDYCIIYKNSYLFHEKIIEEINKKNHRSNELRDS